MVDYRLYCLDGVGRISAAGEVIEAESDDEAIEIVRSKMLHLSCELWQGTRLVANFPASQSA